ncbi:Cof-type HAD-IIB family hydrolase [Lacticaseibacillus absianus]|uniref:Cof-type HAD-IIB family hydrolase n=1 Tax=Lacticaseibacillus absianus TaxID=2729623 RepID=UPI0015CC1789|nr:Cof-type HAD-IIB family hydrolase [Lacticaseibacillus absianus]
MSIKLIALDIDDTLLTSDQTILPSTKAAVAAALARGIKVVLCTGRPLAGVQPFLDALGITGPDQYVVTYNGAVIETVAGQVVAKRLIDRAGYETLTAYAKAQHLPFNVLDEDSVIYTADRDVDAITVVQALENQAGILIRDPEDLPADFAIAKGLFVGDPAQLDAAEPAVHAAFDADYSVIRAGRYFLEVMQAGVDKGQALRDLAALLGFTRDELMAVGDEGNDLAMFAAVGTAVAMGNGSDIAKAAAGHVTGTNDEGGLAAAIERFALTD